MWMYIILGIILLIVVYVFITYNSLVKKRNRVVEAFSTMDVYLKKRWDLIPEIVEVVKGYTKHEKETLEEVVKLRNKNYDNLNYDDKFSINEKIKPSLNKLIALQESYPDLKANEQFLKLSDNLKKAEEDIANSRKYYNGTVRIMNNKIEMFPSNVIAHIFGFKKYKMFEATSEEREAVDVKL